MSSVLPWAPRNLATKFSTQSHASLHTFGSKLKFNLTVDGSRHVFVLNENDLVSQLQDTVKTENPLSRVEFFFDEETRVAAATPISELLGKPVKVEINGARASLESSVFLEDENSIQLDTVLRTVLYRNIRRKLEASPHQDIPLEEFLALCAEEGVDDAQARKLLKNWHDVGICYHCPEHPDTVILNTKQVREAVAPLLAVGRKAERARELEAELARLKAESTALAETHHHLDQRAHTHANRMIYAGILGLTTQMGVLARLTWWDLNWDIMEPITYFITFSTAVVGYAFYIVRKQEYTFFELRNIFHQRHLNKLIKTTRFDVEQYSNLKKKMEELEQQLARIKS